MIALHPHPLLRLLWINAEFPDGLDAESPTDLIESLQVGASSPFAVDDDIKKSVRDLLRHGGFKPSGRNKPASEYLIKAAGGGGLSTINLAVDICNVVSLHSGIPISVVDRTRLEGKLRVDVAEKGEGYIFNASGQVLDLSGLICLFDDQGACANAVKDSQRTKTHSDTREVVFLFWAPSRYASRADLAGDWMQSWLVSVGANVLEKGIESAT